MGWFSDACSAIGGAIGGAISSVCSGIGSLCRGAARCVGGIVKGATKVLSSMGGAIGKLATKASGLLGTIAKGLSTVLTPVLGPLAPIITSIVVDMLSSLLVKAVTPKQEVPMEIEEVEEYGSYLEESEKHPEWKGAEEFNSSRAHLNYLREQVAEANIEIPKAKRLSIDSLNRRTLGMTALWDRLEQQEGLEITDEFLVYTALKGFDQDQFKAILDTSKELKYTTVPYMDLKDGKMSLEEKENFNDLMVKKLRDIKAENGETLSIAEAYETANHMETPLTEKSIGAVISDMADEYEQLGRNLYDPDELKKEYKKYDLPEELDTLEKNLKEDQEKNHE